MQELVYKGKKVMGECDDDLSFMWLLVHTIDDSFGPEHVVRKTPALISAWNAMVNAFDEAYSSSFWDEGVVGEMLTIFVAD